LARLLAREDGNGRSTVHGRNNGMALRKPPARSQDRGKRPAPGGLVGVGEGDAAMEEDHVSKPMTGSEFVTTMSHFHRAEIARMAGWRDRLDLTSNWAITVVAAMLSVSLSTSSAHHGVLIFAMLLVLLLLTIEARRYRFFDVYRTRVRQLERNYFGEIFAPRSDPSANWLQQLGEGLRKPQFLISHREAFARRLRRNYLFMYAILLLAWILKISTPSLQAEGETRVAFAQSFAEAIGHASLGPLPGWLVVLLIAAFYLWLVFVAFFTHEDAGESAHGNVHV
jgi:uncharacterized membrane protein